ncbi:MAG: hypothetical protein V1688_01965 [bacterium]
MNKKIFLKPLILVVIFGAALLCAFYFTKKYDDKTREEGFKHGEESYIETYRVKYQKDTGGSDSPEECYEAFKSAMLEHNLEKALSYVFIDERDKARYYVEGYLKDKKTYEEIVESLPNDIKKSEEYKCDVPLCNILITEVWEGVIIENGRRLGDSVTFVKTFNNKWQIESF